MKFSQKIFENWRFWKTAILKISHFGNFFLLHPNKNQSQIMWWNGWDSILMFSLVSTKFLAMRKISLYSVTCCQVVHGTILKFVNFIYVDTMQSSYKTKHSNLLSISRGSMSITNSELRNHDTLANLFTIIWLDFFYLNSELVKEEFKIRSRKLKKWINFNFS